MHLSLILSVNNPGLVRTAPYRAVTSDTADPPGRTMDAFVLSQGPGYGKYSPISTGRSFLASIPILTPVLPHKIRKRLFRLHPFHNRLHINVHLSKIGPPVLFHYPKTSASHRNSYFRAWNPH